MPFNSQQFRRHVNLILEFWGTVLNYPNKTYIGFFYIIKVNKKRPGQMNVPAFDVSSSLTLITLHR
jgi:hypothetical protein